MSQNRFKTTHQGKQVEVVAGWDRPLQHYFCFVELLQEDPEKEAEYVYNGLEDRNLEMGGTTNIGYFALRLRNEGINMPPTFWDAIALQKQVNAGNLLIDWAWSSETD